MSVNLNGFATLGFLSNNKNSSDHDVALHESLASVANPDKQSKLLPIEQVQLGQRVVTDISEWQRQKAVGSDAGQPSWALGEVNQQSWREISFEAQSKYGHTVCIHLLRSIHWINAKNVVVGNTIHLTLEGLGVDGPAKVSTISDCPHIPEGDGQVVTGTLTVHRKTSFNPVVLPLPPQNRAD